MEKGSVVDAHIDYLEHHLWAWRFIRMVQYRIYLGNGIKRDHNREKREDDTNRSLNRDHQTDLFDMQRSL